MRSQFPVMAVLMGSLMLETPPAHASDTCAALVPVLPAERDMQTHLRQARHFYRKGWIDDAVQEVAMARGTPEGRRDREVYVLSATLARETDNIVGARCLARATIALRQGGEATRTAEALLRELDRSFGYLTIYTAGDATTATFLVEPPTLFATADLKGYAHRMVDRLAKRHPLPVSVALPSGQYTINGQAITVLPGRSQDLTLHPRRTRSSWASPIVRVRTGAEFRPEQAYQPPPVVGSLDLSSTWPVLRGTRASLHTGIRLGGVSGGALPNEVRAPAGGDIGALLSGYWASDYGIDLHVDAALGAASTAGLGFYCPLDGSDCSTKPSKLPSDLLYTRAQGLQRRVGAGVDFRGLGSWESLGIGLDLAYVRTTGAIDTSWRAPDGSSRTVFHPAWSTVALLPAMSLSIRQ